MTENTKEQNENTEDMDLYEVEETHPSEPHESTDTPGFDGKISMETAQRLAKFAKKNS